MTTTYAVFCGESLWGTWDAESADEAARLAAEDASEGDNEPVDASELQAIPVSNFDSDPEMRAEIAALMERQGDA